MASLSNGGGNDDDNDNDNDNIIDEKKVIIDFLDDKKKDMTYSRRIALCLMNQSWYNPMAGVNKEEEEEEKEKDKQDDADEVASIVSSDFEVAYTPSEVEKKDGDVIIDDYDTFVKDEQNHDDNNTEYTKPDLRQGWAHFEHAALYRYRVPDTKDDTYLKRNTKYDLAVAGENNAPTKLYSPLWTPHKQLCSFGHGIGLYFSTLRAIIIITFLCGLFSMYNIQYYASNEYDPNQTLDQNWKQYTLLGSAICDTTSWVPCPTCQCTNITKGFTKYEFFPPDRCAYGNTTDNSELLFVVRNDCDGTLWQLAASNFGVVLFMLIAVAFLGWYLRREEKEFSKSHIDTQNYSIQITDPPHDAKDPEEWHRFFSDNCDGAKVTVCTCAVHNDLLVQTLVERRERILLIQDIQPDISLDLIELARISQEMVRERGFLQRILAVFLPGLPEHISRLVVLNMKVGGLSQLDYPVTNVFVTFETEEDQRHVLDKLMVGASRKNTNNPSLLSDPKYLFRGKHVLAVCEPMAPSDIRWTDLNAGRTRRLKELIITTLITLIAIFLVAFLVYLANTRKLKDTQFNDTSVVIGSAVIITISNMTFPIFAKLLTNTLESHPSESSKQGSMYYKIALFRWMNSTVVFFLITPFTFTLTRDTNGEGLIPKLLGLFIMDMFLPKTLALLDIRGQIRRHIAAPRKKTQDAMNICFQGSSYELAEVYSDMTKTLFMTLFYCSIFPSAFFLCAISLTIKYFVDKFSLLRTWKIAPHVGTKVSKLSRLYFFPAAVVIMAIFCSYYWSSFPFDNICNTDVVNADYIGTFELTPFDPETGSKYLDANETEIIVSYAENDPLYSWCNQDFLAPARYENFGMGGHSFPFTPQTHSDKIDPELYMSQEQLISTTYFGWGALAILIVVIAKMLVSWYLIWRQNMYGRYKAPLGELQGITFSELESKNAYIPKAKSEAFAYPLIACKVQGLDKELFDFKDERRSHKHYDLSLDVVKLLARPELKDLVPGFSVVKYWSPRSK